MFDIYLAQLGEALILRRLGNKGKIAGNVVTKNALITMKIG